MKCSLILDESTGSTQAREGVVTHFSVAEHFKHIIHVSCAVEDTGLWSSKS